MTSTPRGVSSQLWTAARSAAADAHAIDKLGIPSAVLMERAALCVAQAVQSLDTPSLGQQRPVIALVGPGNNGADALAVARILRGRGMDARAWLVTERRNSAAEAQRTLARACGVPLEDSLPVHWSQDAIWVDGLLGTGAVGPPRAAVADALRWLRTQSGPKVAIDVPSGVNVDTGACIDEVFSADVTVTFVRAKTGLLLTPGRDAAGRVVVADIGIPAPDEPRCDAHMVTAKMLMDCLKQQPMKVRHKGDRGHVAVLGGSEGTQGAAMLAGVGALRGGAGLCTWVREGTASLSARPELMVAPYSNPLLPAADVLVVGPGLTRPPTNPTLADVYLKDMRPAVWDASALESIVFEPTAAARVLTPHPGEAARLMARIEPHETWTPARVQSERLHVAWALHQASGAVVVLKGAGTLVLDAGGLYVVLEGSQALATAGTGDVLAGLIGALLARGFEPAQAAIVGASVHGRAGDLAAQSVGTPLALDVAHALPAAFVEVAAGVACPAEPRGVEG